MIEFLETYQIAFYLCFFLLPFLQEDVSVLGAASACASGLANPIIGFIMVALGLTISAALKYAVGRGATHGEWARKYAESPKILKAGDSVKGNLGKSLFMARFISAVRIPFYIGAGFFAVSFPNFLFFVVSSAITYLLIAFGLFHVFGEIAGERLKIYLPIIAIVILVAYFVVSKLRSQKIPISETLERTE